jgi:CRP-like cAMP-binding protein
MGPPSCYPKGTILFREGDPIRSVYLVLSGVMSLRSFQAGREVLVAVRTAGWLLGAASAIHGAAHLATAVAMTPCELRPMSDRDFGRFRRTDAEFRERLQEMLAEEVAEQFARAAAVAGGDCQARLEHLLASLFRASGQQRPDGSVRLTLDLSVTDLANLVGVGREYISRLLPKLSATGVLVRERDWFVATPDSRLLRARPRPIG